MSQNIPLIRPSPQLVENIPRRIVEVKTVIICIQTIGVIALLLFSSEHPSPRSPEISEWRACNKPLGLWNSLWILNTVLQLLFTFQSYPRWNSLIKKMLKAFSVIFFWGWFIGGTYFIYSSIQSCRIAAPHLWWLTFGILLPMDLALLFYFLHRTGLFKLLPGTVRSTLETTLGFLNLLSFVMPPPKDKKPTDDIEMGGSGTDAPDSGGAKAMGSSVIEGTDGRQ